MKSYSKTTTNKWRKRKMNKSLTYSELKRTFVFSFLYFGIIDLYKKNRSIPLSALGFVIVIFASLISFSIKAQNQDVIIIDPYKPTISDAFKINDNPKISDSTLGKPAMSYMISPKLFSTTFELDQIKPAKMIGEPLTKFYKSFVKVGFGSKITPFGEFYFNNLRSTTQSIGVYYRHLSSSGNIKNYAYPGFSDNEAGIYARKFYKNHTLSGEVDYNRNVIHYFGFKTDDFPGISKDSIRQRFAKMGGQLKFGSTYRDSSKFNHSFAIKYFNLSDLYNEMEDHVGFNGSVDKNVKILGKSIENQNIGFKADVDYYNDINTADSSYGLAASFIHHYSFSYNILKLNAGFNASVGKSKDYKLFLYPDINLSLNLYNNFFILYGDISGKLKRNNIIDFSAENPFINTSLPLAFTNTRSMFTGGFKGSLSSYLSFNIHMSKSKVEDMPLFVNDTSSVLLNRFTLVYDTVRVFNTHVEITYQKSEKFRFLLSSDYFKYSPLNELYAWHKPDMNVKISFNYNLKNKIILKTDVFAFKDCYAKTYNNATIPAVVPIKINGTVDFNLGIEYRYSKILSAFLNFNNVGASRYQQWYNYPTYGFNVLGGVTYSL